MILTVGADPDPLAEVCLSGPLHASPSGGRPLCGVRGEQLHNPMGNLLCGRFVSSLRLTNVFGHFLNQRRLVGRYLRYTLGYNSVLDLLLKLFQPWLLGAFPYPTYVGSWCFVLGF